MFFVPGRVFSKTNLVTAFSQKPIPSCLAVSQPIKPARLAIACRCIPDTINIRIKILKIELFGLVLLISQANPSKFEVKRKTMFWFVVVLFNTIT